VRSAFPDLDFLSYSAVVTTAKYDKKRRAARNA